LMIWVILAPTVMAQCGPNKDKPYPSGSTTCPPPPSKSGMQSTADNIGKMPGQGEAKSSATSCTAYPCAVSLLGDAGKTIIEGTDERTQNTLPVGENIYGPFEAGFTSTQDNILSSLGCNPGSKGHLAGGIDTHTAEQMVAYQCGVQLPRIEGNTYVSLIDECGGHTKEYHFHERLKCLYKLEGAHSTKVGESVIIDSSGKQGLYGKYEDFANNKLPLLDACGGHFGVTPDSNGEVVYHYHIQTSPPFTFGCYGPDKNANGKQALVTLEKCRSLYDGCSDGGIVNVTTTAKGTFEYDPWCPCYDADASNVNSAPLAVFSAQSAVKTIDKVPDSVESGGGGLSNNGDQANGAEQTTASGTAVWFLIFFVMLGL